MNAPSMKFNPPKGTHFKTALSRLSIQFGTLAMRYYPDRTYQMAVRLFRKEIEDTPGLLNALKKVGYTHNQRILTPRQIRVIEARLD